MFAILGTTAVVFAEDNTPAPAPSASPLSSIILRGGSPTGSSIFDPLPVTTLDKPLWKDGLLATLKFDPRGDFRDKTKPAKVETPDSDEPVISKNDIDSVIIEGAEQITGKDLLKMPLPLSRAEFEQALKDRKMDPGQKLGELYDEYRNAQIQQSMGALTLSRALDHEGLKRKLPAHVSNKRVDYVVRSLLIRNAIDQKKVATKKTPVTDAFGAPLTDAKGTPLTRTTADEDMKKYSNDQLYTWLRELVSNKTVSFYFDWTYQDGGMDESLQALSSETAFNWPKFVKTENNPLIRFAGVPEKAEDFREQIRLKLESVNTSLRRGTLWQTLLAESPLGIDLQFRALPGEFEKMYQTTYGVKSAQDSIEIPRMEAKVREISITGAKAADVKKRFEALLALKADEATKVIFGDGTRQMTPEEELAAKTKINDLRKSAPDEIIATLKAEFAVELSSKALTIETKAKAFQKSELDPLPTTADMTSEAQEMRIAFNPLFGIQSLLPEAAISGTPTGATLLLLEELASVDAEKVGLKDSRIKQILWKKIQLKTQANGFREIAYKLLSRNTITVVNDTCLDSNWACIATSPRQLADALFPEALCTDSQMPGSSLGNRELLDQVYQISLELLGQAFEVGTK